VQISVDMEVVNWRLRNVSLMISAGGVYRRLELTVQ
jgi:hypothetical protein